MSEWVALTTPERTDWSDVTTYRRDGEGHWIAEMRMQDGKIREPDVGQMMYLTTEELLAIPLVADLLAACEDAREHLHLLVAEGILEYVNTEKLDAAIAKARGTRTR